MLKDKTRKQRLRPGQTIEVLPASPPTPLAIMPKRLVGAAPGPAPLPHLLTVDEVAELLRTTRKAVYASIARGVLPGVIRLSRRLLIDRAALVEWLEQRRAVSLTVQGDQR